MARLPAIVVMALALVLLLGVGAGGVRADEEPAEREGVEIVTTGPMPLVDLLRAVQAVTEVPLVWNPHMRGIQGKELLVTGSYLRCHPDDLLHGLRTLLLIHGVTLVPVGSGENSRVLALDLLRRDTLLSPKGYFVELHEGNVEAVSKWDGELFTAFIRVENLRDLTATWNALARITTGNGIGIVVRAPAARGFVVRDFGPRVATIYRLIRSLDRPVWGAASAGGAREVVFQAIGFRHARATNVAAALVPLLGANRPRPARPEPLPGPAGHPNTPPPQPPVLRVIPDARLNQLLVRGLRKDVERVLAAVEAMDRPVPAEGMVLRVVRLEHLDALGVADALNQMVRRLPPPWPGVEAHTETNAILLHAPEDVLARFEALIAEMDGAP